MQAVEVSVQEQILIGGPNNAYPRTIDVYFYDENDNSVDVEDGPDYQMFLNGSDTSCQSGTLSNVSLGHYTVVPQGAALADIGTLVLNISWTSHLGDPSPGGQDVNYERNTAFEIRGGEAFTVQEFKHSPLADVVENLSFQNIRASQDIALLALERACKGIAFVKKRETQTITLIGENHHTLRLPWDIQQGEITAVTITSVSDLDITAPPMVTVLDDDQLAALNTYGVDQLGNVSIPRQFLPYWAVMIDDYFNQGIYPDGRTHNWIRTIIDIEFVHGYDDVPADVVQGLMALTQYYAMHDNTSPGAQRVDTPGQTTIIFGSPGSTATFGVVEADRVVAEYGMPTPMYGNR